MSIITMPYERYREYECQAAALEKALEALTWTKTIIQAWQCGHTASDETFAAAKSSVLSALAEIELTIRPKG
jgi:23S rRNA A2030 N6-methylase RlmJ